MMPSSPEDFKSAIIKAHKAGDTVGAEKLASVYKQRFGSPKQAPERASLAGEAGRAVARGGADVIAGLGGGILDIANLAAKPLGDGLGYIAEKAGFPETAAGLRSSPDSYTTETRHAIDLLTKGITEERNDQERIIGNAGRFIAGAVGAGGVLGKVSPALAAPKNTKELASAATGGLGYAAAQEYAPDSPLTQIAATVAAGAVPGAIKAVPGAIAKSLGVDPQKVAIIEASGLAPNVAAVGGNAAKRADRVMASLPGGSGIIERSAQKTLDNISSRVKSAVNNVGTAGTMEQAGDALQKGTKQALESFKAAAAKKYAALNEAIPPDGRFPVGNTLGYAARQGEGLTPELAKAFENAKLKPIFQALAKDAVDGQLPFQTIQTLRSRIGELLTDSSLVSDLPRAELKRMYASVSADLEEAAKAAGADAYKKFSEANTFYANNIKRVDRWFERVNAAKKTGEEAFRVIESGLKGGGSKLRNMLDGVPPEQAGTVRATVLERLGKDSSGNGDFSATRFLANYKKLAPEARTELFRGKETYATDIDKLTRATDILGSVRSFENFSRSGEQLAQIGAGALLATNPLTAAKAYLLTRTTASLMQSPRFVRWLAKASDKTNDSAMSSHIGTLNTLAQAEPKIANDIQQLLQDYPINHGRK